MSEIDVLVTGATGAIGPRVVEVLHDAGYSLRLLSHVTSPTGLPDDVEVCNGDITDPSAVQSAMQNVRSVIHIAALLHIVNPPASLRGKYEKINIGGTATLIDAALKADIKRLVMFSTIAVYGPSNGQILAEDSPAQPDTFYGQTKLAAERLVMEARRSDGQPLGTILRLGAVYGARIKGNYQRLVQALARGRFIPLSGARNRRTLVYDRDVARAAALALENPAAVGRIYNVSDGHFHTLNEIISAICEALGRTPPRISLPVGPVRLAAGGLETAARLIGLESPVGRETINKYTEDIAADSQRIQMELGFVPQYDLRAGWQETIKEMRQNRDL